MDDDVGAKGQWPLQGGGANDIVYHEQAIACMGKIGEGRDVGNLRKGVGGGFEKQHSGLGTNGLGPDLGIPRGIHERNERGFDAEARENVGE